MTPNNFMQFQADAFGAFNAMITKSVENFQQLSTLNADLAKSTFERSAEQIQSLIGAQDAKAFSEVTANFGKPNADAVAYMNNVTELTTQSVADMAELVEKQLSEGNAKVDEAIEAFAKVAPAGSEGSINMMRQCVTTSRAAYQQATEAGKQFASVATPAKSKPAKDSK